MLWSLSAVLTWLLRNGAPYCKPASSWGKQRKHPGQGSWNQALQCQHAPSPPSGHWPHTVVTKAGLPGQKGTKHPLLPPASLPKAAEWHKAHGKAGVGEVKSIPATAGPHQCGSGGRVVLCPDHFGIWQGQGAGNGDGGEGRDR